MKNKIQIKTHTVFFTENLLYHDAKKIEMESLQRTMAIAILSILLKSYSLYFQVTHVSSFYK